MEKINHVAIYLRLSRDEEDRGIDEILKNHREELIKLAKNKKYSYEIFEEVASSSTIEKRSEMVRLIERIRQYHFDAVVVMDIDRLSRNEFDQSDIKRLLFDTGTLIVTPYKTYDLRNDEDSLLLGITGLIASQEYKLILKRMQRGKKFAQRQGMWTNGIAPLGYNKEPKTRKLVPNDRAEDVRYIFNEIVNGTTVPTLMSNLASMGIKTREHKNFHYNAILRIINNQAYKGTLISNRTIGRHDDIRPKDEWIIIDNCHEALVDEETWNKANKIVNEYSFKAPRSKNRTYPTSNLIFCGQCAKNGIEKSQGCNMNTKLNKIYIKVCRCGNRVHYYNPVLQSIKEEILKQKETLISALKLIEEGSEIDHTRFELERLEKQLDKLKKALDNIQIQFEEGDIDIIKFRERKGQRESEIKSIESQLEEVKSKDVSVKKKNIEEQIALLDILFGKWELLDDEGLSDEQVNRMLHLLVDKIYWTYTKNDNAEPTIEIIYK